MKKFSVPRILKPWFQVSVFKRLKRRLAREIKQMYTVRKPNGELSYNRREVINVVDYLFSKLYHSNVHLEDVFRTKMTEIQIITNDEMH